MTRVSRQPLSAIDTVDAIGQGQWMLVIEQSALEPLMRLLGAIMLEARADEIVEVRLAKDQEVIEAFLLD